MSGYTYPPLLVVTLVLRAKCVEIPHVVSTVSLFLDSTLDLFLHQACKLGSLALLQRIWDNSEIYENDNIVENFALSLHKYLRTDRHYRQYQFKLSMLEVVKLKNLEMVRWLFERFPECKVYQKALDEAAEQGSLEIVQFFYENIDRLTLNNRGDGIDWKTTFSVSAEARHYEIMWWILDVVPMDQDNLQWALQSTIVHGDFHVAEQLISLGGRWFFFHIAYSVGLSGRMDVLEWAAQQKHLSRFINVVYGASVGGHLDVVQWAVKNHLKFDEIDRPVGIGQIESCIYVTLVCGHKDIAQYLHSITKWGSNISTSSQPSLNSSEQLLDSEDYALLQPYFNVSSFNHRRVMTRAATNGHFDVVQWIYETFNDDEDGKLQFYLDLKSDAAFIGHLEMVKWLHQVQLSVETNFKHDISGFRTGATNENFGVVRRRSQTGTQRTSICAIDTAAKGGHLEVVQWLFKHANEGCTTAAIDGAASNGHLNVVKWLHENSHVGCTERAMDGAARNGHLELVQWLHENRTEGCTTKAMGGAAENGFLAVVKWLHANRTEGSTTCAPLAMDLAAKGGYLRVVQWLHTHRSGGCSYHGLRNAATHKHFEVFLFLHERFPSLYCPRPKKNRAPEIKNWIREHLSESQIPIPDELLDDVDSSDSDTGSDSD